MPDDLKDGDAELVRVMTRTAQRILAGERAYDVCVDTTGALVALLGKAHNDGTAYVLWAEIGDLVDSPRGPQSESACNGMAAAAAADWLSVEIQSPEAVASYFDRWNPATGSAWLAKRAP
jgi:hypothetical protein